MTKVNGIIKLAKKLTINLNKKLKDIEFTKWVNIHLMKLKLQPLETEMPLVPESFDCGSDYTFYFTVQKVNTKLSYLEMALKAFECFKTEADYSKIQSIIQIIEGVEEINSYQNKFKKKLATLCESTNLFNPTMSCVLKLSSMIDCKFDGPREQNTDIDNLRVFYEVDASDPSQSKMKILSSK